MPRIGAEDILRVVGRHHGVSREEMLGPGRRESRQVAMHFLKTHTGMTNSAIGELCGGISYSAVPQAHRPVQQRCKGRPGVCHAHGGDREGTVTWQGLTPTA